MFMFSLVSASNHYVIVAAHLLTLVLSLCDFMRSGSTNAPPEEIIPMLPVNHAGEPGHRVTPTLDETCKTRSNSSLISNQQKSPDGTAIQPKLVEIKHMAAALNSDSTEASGGAEPQPKSVRESLNLGQYNDETRSGQKHGYKSHTTLL